MLLAASAAVTTISTVALLTGYAFSSRIADLLPHSTGFVITFVFVCVALVFVMQWIAKHYRL
jgi:hypothetical protein